MKEKLSTEQISRAVNPETVNVHVPIEVMWDSDRLAGLKKDILGRLGCLSCTSGFDIRWRTRREYIVNPALEVRELSEFGR